MKILLDGLRARPIGLGDFPAIEALFGARGACGGCWCMIWRVPTTGADYWNAHKGAKNKAAFEALVRGGKALGCLAYDGDEPVGWCSFGPRADFGYLSRSRTIPASSEEGVWSITCFYIKATHRRRGLSRLLIATACVAARRAGARYIEGYPTPARSSSAPAAFVHTGLPSPFTANGFKVVSKAGARLVMRKRL